MLTQPSSSAAFLHGPMPSLDAIPAASIPSSSSSPPSRQHSTPLPVSLSSTVLPTQAQPLPSPFLQLYPQQSLHSPPFFFFPQYPGHPFSLPHSLPSSHPPPSTLVDVQQAQSAFSAFVSASSPPSSSSSTSTISSSSSSSSSFSSPSPRPPVGLAIAGLLGLSHSASSSTSAPHLPSPAPHATLPAPPSSLLTAPSSLLHPTPTGLPSPVAIKLERGSPLPSNCSPRSLPPSTPGSPQQPPTEPTLAAPTPSSLSSLSSLARHLTSSLSLPHTQSALRATLDAVHVDTSTLQADIASLIHACNALNPHPSTTTPTPPAAITLLLALLSTRPPPASYPSPPASVSPSPTPCPHCSSQKKGTRWSSSDDGAMVAMVREGKDWEEVAVRLRRTVRALKDRYCALKKAEERRKEGREDRGGMRRGGGGRHGDDEEDDGEGDEEEEEEEEHHERRSRREREKARKKRKRRRGVAEDSSGSDVYSESSRDESDDDDDLRRLPPHQPSHSSHSPHSHARHRPVSAEQPSSNGASHEEGQRPRPQSEAVKEEQREEVEATDSEAMPSLSTPTSPASPSSSSSSSSTPSASSFASSTLAPSLGSTSQSLPTSSSALLPWTSSDEFRLFSLLNSGLTIRDASAQLGRTVAAVKGRLQRLKRKRELGAAAHSKEEGDEGGRPVDADEERGAKGSDVRRPSGAHPLTT